MGTNNRLVVLQELKLFKGELVIVLFLYLDGEVQSAMVSKGTRVEIEILSKDLTLSVVAQQVWLFVLPDLIAVFQRQVSGRPKRQCHLVLGEDTTVDTVVLKCAVARGEQFQHGVVDE